jgi:hypothetical protein
VISMNEGEILVSAMVVGEAATAVAKTAGRAGQGWAKCHPSDKPKAEVGLNLAIARALEDLAKQYHKKAEKAGKR